MKLVYALVLFSVIGLVIPAYAQDARYTELEQEMKDEVDACKVKLTLNLIYLRLKRLLPKEIVKQQW